MDKNYQILEVQRRGAAIVAVLPLDATTEQTGGALLSDDLNRLAHGAAAVVVLDLRASEGLPASVLCRIVGLSKSLQDRSITLYVLASGRLRDLMCITRMDRMLHLLDTWEDEEETAPDLAAIQEEPAAAAIVD